MKILYLISKYLTIPATIIKGLWEHITCGVLNVLVEDGRYLQPNELCGHVDHEFTTTKSKTFFISWLPSVINAALAFFLSDAGFVGLFVLKVSPSDPIFWLYVILLYLGISFSCNMFPLFEDALNNWNLIYQQKLTDEEKEENKRIAENLKTQKAYNKEAKKIAKEKQKESTVVGYDHNSQKSSKAAYDPIKAKKNVIKKETNLFVKIILFIPSVIMLAGSFLEKYAITFILSIITIVLAIFVF